MRAEIERSLFDNREIRLSNYASVFQIDNGLTVLSQALTQQQVFGDERLTVLAKNLGSGLKRQDVHTLAKNLYPQQELEYLYSTLSSDSFIRSSDRTESVYDYVQTEDALDRNYRLLRILLTDVCNLACNYCKVMPNFVDVTKRATSFGHLEKAIGLFFEGSQEQKPKVVHISGGEPTIAWDHIGFIVDTVERHKRPNEKYFIVIGTNAMLLTEDKVNFLAEHNVKAIVSMDGQESIHNSLRLTHSGQGSFDKVDRGVRLLKEKGVELGLSLVVGRHNVDNLIPQIGWMIHEYQPVSMGVNYMKPPTRELKDYPYLITPQEYVDAIYQVFKTYRHTGVFFELLYRRLDPFVNRGVRRHDCGAASGTTINVDPKGNIGPCKSFLILNELSAPIDLQISEDSGNHPVVIDSLRERSSLFKGCCQNCGAIGICGNGCAYEAQIDSGDMMGIDARACDYTKLFFDKFVNDLGDTVSGFLKEKSFYIPTMEDRRKIYGNMIVDEMTLCSSIGHINGD